ncbi:unnamed protein product [Amoebophrya sp. A25]|nr:unnamed protein product [Amoebophrya sp. A25]|eukprot:GSA25T00016459001.1
MGRLPAYYEVGNYGDGREGYAYAYVEATAERGNPRSVLEALETFHKRWSMLHVGPLKGEILDDAVRQAALSRMQEEQRSEDRKRDLPDEQRVQHRRKFVALEVGGYIGYSAVRMAKTLLELTDDTMNSSEKQESSSRPFLVVSLERNAENASYARKIVEFAGVHDCVKVIQGSLQRDEQEEEEAPGSPLPELELPGDDEDEGSCFKINMNPELREYLMAVDKEEDDETTPLRICPCAMTMRGAALNFDEDTRSQANGQQRTSLQTSGRTVVTTVAPSAADQQALDTLAVLNSDLRPVDVARREVRALQMALEAQKLSLQKNATPLRTNPCTTTPEISSSRASTFRGVSPSTSPSTTTATSSSSTPLNNTSTSSSSSYRLAGVNLLFLDHQKARYCRDLKMLEAWDVVQAGTFVVADNVASKDHLANRAKAVARGKRKGPCRCVNRACDLLHHVGYYDGSKKVKEEIKEAECVRGSTEDHRGEDFYEGRCTFVKMLQDAEKASKNVESTRTIPLSTSSNASQYESMVYAPEGSEDGICVALRIR